MVTKTTLKSVSLCLAWASICLALTTPVIAKTPPKIENLYCMGEKDEHGQALQVALLANSYELYVNGDVHYIKTHGQTEDARMLYTYDYLDIYGEIVYLSLASVNKGHDKGIYIVQYRSSTDEPMIIGRLKCHRSKV